MSFHSPWALWLLPVCVGLAIALALTCRREFHRRLALFAGARLPTSLAATGALRRKQLRLLLIALALLLLVLALARPQAGPHAKPGTGKGINLLIAIDGSESMLAEDVPSPAVNRFGLAQAGIENLFARFQSDRAGLMMFGGQATLVSPLTFDTVSLQLIERGLSTELVGKGGSSLAGAIQRAAVFFHGRPYGSRILLLVSDGEETEGDAVVAAAEAYRQEGLRIFTVGVGTEKGAPIPLMRRNEQRAWVRVGTVHDQAGLEVTTRMNAKVLRAVAAVAGGTYTDLAEAKGDLGVLYPRDLQPLATAMAEGETKERNEWFPFPLAVALVLLAGEFLWPVAQPSARTRRQMAAVVLILGVSLAARPLRAGVADVQRLIDAGRADEAFEQLRDARLKAPDSLLAAYNYAVGAYVAGKFDVALETFGKLAVSADPAIANRSAFQLGNSLYRQGEAMQATNPEGTLALWTKAASAFARAPGQPAAQNFTKTQADLLTLLRALAQAKEAEGDEAARLAPARGVAAWRAGVGYLDQALALNLAGEPARALAAAKVALVQKIFSAFSSSAEDKLRQAELQKDADLEHAVGLIKEAISDYDEALGLQPGDVAAQRGKAAALAHLEPWQLEWAEAEHARGEAVRAVALEDALAHWQKAGGIFDDVLRAHPASAAAIAGRRMNNRSLHDGQVQLGDRQQTEADEASLAAEARDAKRESALGHYQVALTIEPGDAATKAKVVQLGQKLVGVFVQRGEHELTAGRELAATPKPEGAIPWLERSVQSFAQALHFETANARAQAGKAAAEALLRKLRGDENRVLAHSQQLKNAEAMKDPGKLALKLIDYDTDKLAAKKPQNFTIPENRPVKNW